MKRMTLAALLLALGCNSKSPEQPDNGSTTPPSEGETEVVEQKIEEQKKLPDLAEPTHVAYDLLHNRPLAHDIVAGTTFAVADRPDFVRNSHANHGKQWKLGVDIDGTKAAVIKKARKAKVWMPAVGKSAKSVTLRYYNPTKNPNKLTIKLNGESLGEKTLESGWQTISYDAKGKADVENTVEISTTGMDRISKVLSGGAIAWVSIGDASQTPTETPVSGAQDALTLTKGNAAMWNVWGLPKSHLRFAFQGCGVDVTVEAHDAQPTKKTIQPLEGGGELQQSSFALDFGADRLNRVTVAPADGCESVTLKQARLILPGETPTVPKVEPPQLVLFWMIDTLRADHLPIDFETDVQAPHLRKLASEGASFSVAYVQGNESKTSHASLFSAMYPNKHKLVGKGRLRPQLTIMPEAIKAEGYKTGAYISNGYVSKPWGFVQGWDMYQNNLRENKGGIHGMRMAQSAIKWITKNKDKKAFMYVGTIDPHVTYRRHEHLIDRYDPEPYSGRFKRHCLGTDLGLIATGKLKINDRDKKRIHALYKNEIEFNDESFGWLRGELEKLGVWDKTMVVVTSDHGEQFWERGGVGHGSSVHADQVHVPFIVYYPPLVPAGTKVSAGVDVLDMYPTIVDAIGGERPDGLQGKSTLPLVHMVKGDYPEPAIATNYLTQYGLQMKQWKLYLKKSGHRMFDRKNDNSEKTDVASDRPYETRWLIDAMSTFRQHRNAWDKTQHGVASNLSPKFLELVSAEK